MIYTYLLVCSWVLYPRSPRTQAQGDFRYNYSNFTLKPVSKTCSQNRTENLKVAHQILDTRAGPGQHQATPLPGRWAPSQVTEDIQHPASPHPSDLPHTSFSDLASVDPKLHNLPRELRATGGPSPGGDTVLLLHKESQQFEAERPREQAAETTAGKGSGFT